MSKTSTTKLFNYLPLVWALLFTALTFTHSISYALPAAIYWVWFMWAPLDTLCTFGPLYWMTRRGSRLFHIGYGTMHQTSAPWRKGAGLVITVAKRSVHMGLSRKQNLEETDGLLSAVKGRYLDTSPSEIGEWNAVPKRTKEHNTAS